MPSPTISLVGALTYAPPRAPTLMVTRPLASGVELPGGAAVPALLGVLGLRDEGVGERGSRGQELARPAVLAAGGGLADGSAGAVDLVDGAFQFVTGPGRTADQPPSTMRLAPVT